MRSIRTKLLAGLAITVIGVFAADNTLGTWKLNMEKSKFSPSAPVKSITVTREASDNGAKTSMTGERADGTPINGAYTAKYDGKEYDVTGAPYDKISLKRLNAHTFEVTQRKEGGKYRQTGRNVFSKNGKTLTATRKGTDADGKAYSATMVFERQ
jgi:hypothetical protein